jgi:CheY-like chemotaxis protein
MISHELKTPMQTIMSSLDLLSVQPAEKDKEIWKRLNSSVEHLEMQMKDLTDYARLESGRLHLRTLPIDATKLLTNIAVEFREVAENKGLVFTTDIENIGQKLLSDSLRIEQIANNLIGNAIKYTETGHVKVGLRYIENHSHLVLSVEDTGVGISDKDKRTLFEPFTQIDQTSTRKHDGIGMGLAVVQKLVILFGGSISVTSVVGKGSTFTVMLPAEKSPITISETMSDEDDADSNRRVMLVDDNQNVRETLKAVLEQLTYSCDAAEDGSHALKFLEQRKYAAILLDVNMPVMDGFAVASRIRNTVGRNQEVPIIWISATQPQNITPEEKALFTHFLEKPIRANKLDAMLKKIVT